MSALTKEPKRMPRKPASSSNRKTGTGTTESVFTDLFSMVEDIFGSDIHKPARK